MNTEAFPLPTSDEVKARVLKTETIQLRLTKIEKDDLRRVASRLSLSITDYILKCHEVVAAKLEKYAQFFEDFDNKAAQKSSLYEQLYDQPDVNVVDVKKL